MSHSAGKINVYDVLGRAFFALVKLLGTVGFHLHEVGQAQAKSTDESDVHKFTAGKMIGQVKTFVVHGMEIRI
jgi:hypothetical protein